SDNASTDGGAGELAAIDDSRFRFLRNAENYGSFENQLRAMEAARGRYVMQMTDKDDLVFGGEAAALSALEGLDAACGEFVLNGGGDGGRAVTVRRGYAAYRRYGLLFTHPSGHFFSSEILRRHGVLARLRALDEVTRPYSTDYLVSLSLAYGAYARIDLPFAVMNLPPYGGGAASVSYRDPSEYYFTPEFLSKEFSAYVKFLREGTGLSAVSRWRLVARLAGGPVFDQMTLWYRWRLDDDAMCEWYGVNPDFRRRERARDLERDGAAAIRGAAGLGFAERLAARCGVARRLKRGGRRTVPSNIRRAGK
ncbi:MAG: hypothetical protein J6T01_06290, partial [Kiritimatiellae bacterium]|nr:hypothetical protein [Kiritimatiellia bacterium]